MIRSTDGAGTERVALWDTVTTRRRSRPTALMGRRRAGGIVR